MKLAPLLLLSVLLSVASAAEILINWSIPFGQPALPPAYVTEGDTLLFRWDGPIPHNVLISPAGNCDLSSAILLGQESGVRYTFQARDVGEMTFYLNKIESWCFDRGIRLTIPIDSEYSRLMERQDG